VVEPQPAEAVAALAAGLAFVCPDALRAPLGKPLEVTLHGNPEAGLPLPKDITLFIANCDYMTRIEADEAHATFVCVPSGAGEQWWVVKDRPQGTVLWGSDFCRPWVFQ
jgi:hypothetical protein